MSLTPESFSFVADLVRREAAIVLEPGKEYLVDSRLTPVSKEFGFASVNDLVSAMRLRGVAGYRAAVVDALTTNETFWFRDQEPFDVLADVVFPEILAEGREKRSLTIWSGACSSGQEAYSIAMLASEHLLPLGWTVNIVATDISEKMLARTRAARYSQLEVGRGLASTRLGKYLRQDGNEWVVDDRLRSMVSVRSLNLAAPFGPMPVFDIVFMRNVLIYFDRDTKAKILGQVRKVMAPGGYLFLGAAETTIGIDEVWQRQSIGRFTLNRLRPPGGADGHAALAAPSRFVKEGLTA